MLRRSLLLLCLVLALGWIVSAEESDPRQAPPPGRALPPAPELDEEGTVKAAMPVRHGSLRDELEAQAPTEEPAAPKAKPRVRPAFRIERKATAERPKLRETDSGIKPQSAQALAESEPQTASAPAGTGRELRGKLALPKDQWGRLERQHSEPASPEGRNAEAAAPAADYRSESTLRQPAKREFGAPRQALPRFELPGAMLFQLDGNFTLDSGTLIASSQGAAFSGPSALRGAPLELALPVPPPRMPEPAVRASLTELSRGGSKRKRVALTFDDGPHPEYTSQLLAILDHYDARATFFVVGIQCQKYPHWVKMIQQGGHELANHTFDHFRLPELPAEEQVYQIDECTRLVEQLTGTTPRFFRPPGGRYDDEVARLLRQRGMVLALWDAALNDTAEDREAADLLKSAGTQIRPGSIVLVHDGVQATVDMLPQLIERLQQDGYELVTLSELAAEI